MTRTPRHLGRLLAVAAAAALLTATTAAPARAAAPGYVALGDSYSSGSAAGNYLADGTNCERSVNSYPSLIAAARGYQLNLRACAGATTTDVAATQLAALSGTTGYVTVSVGGNDIGFGDVLTQCALPGWMSNCDRAIDTALTRVNTVLPGPLSALYRDIRAKAPNARVVVVGYPRLFNGTDCHPLTFFSSHEMTRLNAGADALNAQLRALATAAGFGFADPVPTFAGHAVCSASPYLTNLTLPVGQSFHPNQAGHRYGYTPAVSTPLTGSQLAVSAGTLATAANRAAELTAMQLKYTAVDRLITPKGFVAPDLSTPQARAAATRAGVDLTSRASILAADARYSAAQAATWQRSRQTAGQSADR